MKKETQPINIQRYIDKAQRLGSKEAGLPIDIRFKRSGKIERVVYVKPIKVE